MSTHLDENELALLAEKGEARLPLERRVHLATCESCQRERAALERTEEARQLSAPEAAAPLARGASVGRYLILGLLGQGGMGSVYAAYDGELERKVAVKVLRTDARHAGTPEAQLRLLREAQAMARISHPNVLAIHDVGTVGDGVFLAMELVDGTTLKGWLRQSPRSPREILDAFIQAGLGLDAAHRAGLVHRDFKPDNVLVRKDGRVFVTDFGLARLATSADSTPFAPSLSKDQRIPLADSTPADSTALASALTRTGAVMGTPRYMSPEQHLGKTPDARSDQFSFCAALYWALFRERPFDPERLAAAAAETESETRTAPLQRDSKLAASPIHEPPREPRIALKVRRAVMRGLSLSPADRFPSMGPLLDALAPEQKRRTWPWVAAAGLLGLSLVGGVALTQARERAQAVCSGGPAKLAGAWDAPLRQAVERAFLATGSKGAKAAYAQVTRELDDYAARWTGQYKDACEATAIRKEQPESVLTLRMVCLDRDLVELRAFTHLLSAADAALVDQAAQAAGGLSAPQDCADVSTLSRTQPLPGDPTRRAEIRGVQDALSSANALKLAGQFGPAQRKAEELLDRAAPLSYPPLTAEALYFKATLLDQTRGYDELSGLLLRALEEADAGAVDTLRVQIASELTYVAARASRFDQGVRWAEAGQAVLRRVGGHPALEAGLLNNLGTLYLSRGQFDQAAKAFARAIARLTEEPEPNALRLALFRSNLALSYAHLSRLTEAKALIDQAFATYLQIYGPDNLALADRYTTLSEILLGQRDYPGAREAVDHALAITRRVQGEDSPRLAGLYDTRATILQEAGHFDEARRDYQAGLSLKERHIAAGDPDFAYSYGGIGQCLVELGKHQEAVGWLEKALAIKLEDPGERGNSLFALARALWDRPSTRSRARKAALDAQRSYRAAGAADREGEAKAWLAAHPG